MSRVTSPPLPAKPRLLDLFCGAGGAAVGYARAGFEVVGVDHVAQPHYPFEFVQGDAMEYLVDEILGMDYSHGEFDAIHASPLWWKWTHQARGNGTADEHPDDVGPTLELLQRSVLPFVLEVGTLSPQPATVLCGASCGLEVIRHMRFMTSWPLMVPPCAHKHGGCADGLYVAYRHSSTSRTARGWRPPARAGRKQWRAAAGLDWMNDAEGELAVPPAYTELIGHQLLQHLNVRAA